MNKEVNSQEVGAIKMDKIGPTMYYIHIRCRYI